MNSTMNQIYLRVLRPRFDLQRDLGYRPLRRIRILFSVFELTREAFTSGDDCDDYKRL